MMRDPAGVPVWLQILTLIVWMAGLGVWVERNRFGGTKDQAADIARLRAERDRARAELEERRRSAMPTLTLIRGEIDRPTAHAISRGLRRISREHGSAAL